MMKTKILKYGFCILLACSLAGCDDYAQKTIEKKIYVDRLELSMFVGESMQLTASPTDGTYQFSWSSEDPEVATVTSNGLVEVVGEGFTNIVVKSGDILTKVPLTAVVRVPITDVTINETSLVMYVGNKKSILVSYLPENANDIPPHSWRSRDTEIATVSESGEITAVGEGVTKIIYSIGEIEKEIEVDAAFTRPFKGPHTLSAATPYELLAANFDFGGEGNAFHDSDATDSSGQNGKYRVSNGDDNSTAVDIEGDGINVGWTNVGEWLMYTVEVEDAGNYLVEAQVAANATGGFHLEVDGVNVTGTIETPNTGGWGSYNWTSTPEDKLTLNLTKGTHKIKYYFDGGHNFKSLRFTKK